MDRDPEDRRRASLRASDADREQFVEALCQHHAAGRLTVEELTERTERAYAARTFGDRDALATDLPPLRHRHRRRPAPGGRPGPDRNRRAGATAPAGQPPGRGPDRPAPLAAVVRPAQRRAAGRLGDERPRLLLADLAHHRLRAVPRLAGLQRPRTQPYGRERRRPRDR